MSNRIISKKALILTLLMPVVSIGCSSQLSNRIADGGDGYLKAPALEPLTLPDGLKLPKEVYDYGIYENYAIGESGKNLDVRPPLLPAPTTENSYASYSRRIVKSDIPAGTGFWNSIPLTLEAKNIPIINYSNDTIQTGEAVIMRTSQEQSVEASFVIKRENNIDSNREKFSIELINLTKKGKVIADPIEIQYYVVNLYNELMAAIAPIPESESKSIKPSKKSDTNGMPKIAGLEIVNKTNDTE